MPANAHALSDGTFFHDGALYVRWQTETGTGMAHILRDSAGYRIAQSNGTPGPAIARQVDGSWELADHTDNYAEGSVLAHFVHPGITVDPGTLQHAARIMRGMGLTESQLNATVATHRQGMQLTTILSVGQSFVETLNSRLRDANATEWTHKELRILAPAIARYTNRPLAIYRNDPNGRPSFNDGISAEGTPFTAKDVPGNALRVVLHDNGTYSLMGDATGGTYRSFFAAVEAATRPTAEFRAMSEASRESIFRNNLAADLDTLPSRALVDRMLASWIEPLNGHGLQAEPLKVFARLRAALFDRMHALTAEEERVFLAAARDLMPVDRRVAIEVVRHGSGSPGERLAMIDTATPSGERVVIEASTDADGRRTAYYRRGEPGSNAMLSRPIPQEPFSPIIDVLLNADNGKIRNALALNEWDFRRFAEGMLAKIAETEDSLLPPSLDRLVVTDPAILAEAENQPSDHWTTQGRQFVRLRNMAGTTQIVETRQREDGFHEVLGYSDGLMPEAYRYHYVEERQGKWYPSIMLRSGIDPLSDLFRDAASRDIFGKLPPHARINMEVARRIADKIAYPILVDFMAQPSTIQLTDSGEILLSIGIPAKKQHRTGVDYAGRPVRHVEAIPTTISAFETPPLLTRSNALASLPQLRGASPAPVSDVDIATFNDLIASGAPVGDFLSRGVGNRQIQALANARRLRGLLREDRYMVLVGSAAGHPFTLAMPVNAESIRLTGSTGATGVRIAELPEGSYIVDDWYGVTATRDDYPGRVRAVASQWESNALQVETPQGEARVASSPVDFTERLLSTTVEFQLWSPRRDPIREDRYLQYIHDRHANPRETVRAGLDWLESSVAQGEYSRYFPDPITHPATGSRTGSLLRAALELGEPVQADGAAGVPRPDIIVRNEQVPMSR
ncbi:hypothetical protein [Luteibacter yeojuensis]|uniref:Uncharacterized protein n=1 Tax=Luteibacter yeojuensis TaxID=345309 RepID=A0A7X5TRB9_9GAMM|nr:hypothetical protein [Luteibacter yeojuensis]NID17000.1 hypothetical protein [Luteibacter yeojuensis]